VAVAVGLGLALAAPVTAGAETFYVASLSDGGIAGFWGFGAKSSIHDEGLAPSPLPQPRDLAMSPDGRTIYAVTGDALTPVDRDTRALGTPVPVGAGDGSRIAVTPDGRTALVTSPGGDKVTPVDTVAGTAGTPILLTHPTDVAVTPDGKTAYVLTAGSTLTPIDLATGAPKTAITLSHPGAAITITPDGALALVAESEGQQTSTPGPSAMQVVDLSTGTPELPVALSATGVVSAVELTADGKTAYVAITDGTIIPFDVASRTPAAPVVIRHPADATDTPVTDLAVTTDGQHLLGTAPCKPSCDGSVFSINFNQPSSPPPGGNPAGATTFGGYAAVTSPGTRPAPSSIVLAPNPGVLIIDRGAQHNPHPQMDLVHTLVANASNPGGSVTEFTWRFGDGSPDLTSAAGTVDHAFPRYDTYKVTLTTTNHGGCAATVVYTGHSATCTGRTTATASRIITVAPVPIPVSAHTGPASGITASGATLNGTIDVQGYGASWHFEYGTTSRYGHSFPARTLPGSPATLPVSRTLTTLRPKTLYHYRLVAETLAGTSTSEDATFTTRATGTLPLRSTTLPLSGTRAVAALRCASHKPCRGRLTLTIRARNGHQRVVTSTCGHAAFSLKAAHSGRTRIPLSALCRSRLRHAPTGHLAAKLTSRTTTGQTDLATTVRLTR
jgi:hypothetical protein